MLVIASAAVVTNMKGPLTCVATGTKGVCVVGSYALLLHPQAACHSRLFIIGNTAHVAIVPSYVNG